MKRVLALVVAGLGAAMVQQRIRARQAEQALWAEATDPAPR
ncbi:DLW-39 family protein [Gephyromycinifex aptenodytis]|nr:DLW-39 family protein [Gephyromycinifex aptenodytis]